MLSSLRDDCHKISSYSYPRVTLIQMDVHPAEET
jgi:hypothetical protein